MADEIALSAKLTCTKNDVSVTNAVSEFIQSMDADLEKMTHLVQAVGTSEEAVQLGDIDISNATGDEYFLLLANRNDTNFVMVKVKITAGPTYWQIGILRPGETWGPCRLPKLDGSSLGGIYLDADTAECDVEVVACEAGTPPP